MRSLSIGPRWLVLLICANEAASWAAQGASAVERKTEVSIWGDAFLINGQPTYGGRTWQGK